MDGGFLAVVAVTLCFLSGMIACRMRARGASAGEIALPVVELWVAFALWIAIFRLLAVRIGDPEAAGPVGELQDLGQRVAALKGAARYLFAAGVGVSVAILGHLLWSLGRLMRS